LNDAHLNNTNLISANLEKTSLNGAFLGGAKLINADLNGADISNTNLRDTDFKLANLKNIVWNERTDWSKAKGLNEAVNIPPNLSENLQFKNAVFLCEYINNESNIKS
jgi:uncharacterized protein YjbI with pentapeptide repeats